MTFELEEVCKDNLLYYGKYEMVFEMELNKYQSRIYPSENAEKLRWYHIKSDGQYIGAIWLEKKAGDAAAVLGIFIVDRDFRNHGIGKSVIQQIIINDLHYMGTDMVILRVRAENQRAIACYKQVGFREKDRYRKGRLDVVEMMYR